MLYLFKSKGKRLYESYLKEGKGDRKKAIAEVVEKYKEFSDGEKNKFRKLVGKRILKANDSESVSATLLLASEIGKATEWKDDETDDNIVRPLKRFLEKQNNTEEVIAALDALFNNNYGEAEFWERMLRTGPAVALHVIEKISGVEGAEEFFIKNFDVLLELSDKSKKCRDIVTGCAKRGDDKIKKSLLEKIISTGLYEEFIDLLPNLLESRQTRYKLLGWLASNKIRIVIDKKKLAAVEQIPLIAAKIRETEKELVEKAAAILPKLPHEEKLLVHHFLLTRGVRAKEEDLEFLKDAMLDQRVNPVLRKTALETYLNNSQNPELELEKQIEERLDSILEMARPTALIEAYDLGSLLQAIKSNKAEIVLKAVYEEAVDVLEDAEASTEQKKIAAAVAFLYIHSQGKKEECKEVHEKALAILKENGQVMPII